MCIWLKEIIRKHYNTMSLKENDIYNENAYEKRCEEEGWSIEDDEQDFSEVKEKIDTASTTYLDNQYYVYRDMVLAELPKEAHRALEVLLLIHREMVTRRTAADISKFGDIV